jgi:hypothetical protein
MVIIWNNNESAFREILQSKLTELNFRWINHDTLEYSFYEDESIIYGNIISGDYDT